MYLSLCTESLVEFLRPPPPEQEMQYILDLFLSLGLALEATGGIGGIKDAFNGRSSSETFLFLIRSSLDRRSIYIPHRTIRPSYQLGPSGGKKEEKEGQRRGRAESETSLGRKTHILSTAAK